MKDARTRWERLNLIRKEKFRIILPIAMRENEIDMWIHVMREGNPDPLTIDLGGDNGYFVLLNELFLVEMKKCFVLLECMIYLARKMN
ncbi:MAG: hypothetical protein GPJ52_09000 [Candidatus Heimdallarchaeota archaeon]|nr:hypothetical protein [Candidatus Heimdallarchaeota archaeon]